MRSISIYEIRSALKYGEEHQYTLFPEIRDARNINKIEHDDKVLKMKNDTITYAHKIQQEKPPKLSFELFTEFSRNGNRINYEKAFFESKKQLHALVMAEVLQGTGEYLESIQERLWDWCNTYSWELPAHVPLTPDEIEEKRIEPDEVVALFSAETGFYFAEILSLLQEQLHPLLAYRLKKEIFRRVIDSYMKRAYFWEAHKMNWSSVCAGAVGCSAIYMIDDIDELSILLHRVMGAMESYLLGFDKSGITTEGLGYWAYGFSFFVYFAELLRERTCGKIDLLNGDEQIKKIAEMPLYIQFPDNHMINFSDVPGEFWEGEYGILNRLAKRFHISEYNVPKNLDIFRDHTSKWALMARNIFWGLDRVDEPSLSTKTGVFYFSESQWLIDRRMPSSGEFVCFAAKGGHNGEPHNHNDLGHFLLHYNTDPILIDLGAPEYTKQFFSKDRYSILHASSRGHSVPMINGKTQMEGQEHGAKVIECKNKNGCTYFKLDVKEAYDLLELLNYERSFMWDYNGLELTIEDEFQFTSGENTVEQIFVTAYEPKLLEAGVGIIEGKKSKTEIIFDTNATCEIIKDEYRNHQGQEAKSYRICIKYKENEQRLKTCIRIKVLHI